MLLFIVKELLMGGSVAVAVGISDMQKVPGDTQHVTDKT